MSVTTIDEAATTPTTLVDEIERAGLGGLGGAGFPTAVKLRSAHRARATLIVNACDGDIGAVKDGWVVANRLSELRRGADLAAAGRPVVWAAHRGSPTAETLRAAGLTVMDVPHHFVSSEETSLVSLLHGGSARPMTRRVPFVYGGHDGRGRRVPPTLVLNAETVWRIAQIATYGADWFRSMGTESEPGPRLVAVSGHVGRPGVIEAAAGIPFRDLFDVAGGLLPGAEHVLVGGLGGALVSLEKVLGTTWSAVGLSSVGGGVGAGLIEVVDPTRCPLEFVGSLLEYGAGESAHQCGPCMFGLPSLAQQWRAMSADPTPGAVERLQQRIGLVSGRGACRHPDGVARLATTALSTLEPHLREHAQGRCTPRRTSHVA